MAQKAAIGPAGGTVMGFASRAEAEPSEPLASRATAQSRALVRITRAPRSETYRPGAAFLAQLIACKRKMPQTRERRRAEPQEAAERYAQALAVIPLGLKLSRCL